MAVEHASREHRSKHFGRRRDRIHSRRCDPRGEFSEWQHGQPSDKIFRAIRNETLFCKADRECEIRNNARSVRDAGVAIEPSRQIEGKHRGVSAAAQLVDRARKNGNRRAERSSRSDAEDAVEHDQRPSFAIAHFIQARGMAAARLAKFRLELSQSIASRVSLLKDNFLKSPKP